MMLRISLLLTALSSCSQVARAAADRPNFILIFCDDLGFGDLRKSYGHPYAETPHIDRLATEGTSFKQFHVNGNVCPVTRAGLMTSRNPSWFPNYTEDYGFMGQPTVTNVLQNAGYLTAHIGKWNIGPDPEKDAVEYGIDYLRFTGSIPNDPRGREGLRIDEAVKFLEQHDSSKPFYLNLWLYSTHSPINPPDSFVQHFKSLSVDRDKFGYHMQTKLKQVESQGGNIDEYMRIYLGEVLALDTQVGRLLSKLDDLGLTDNTVVVFSSDNGPERLKRGLESLGYAGGLRGEKHSYYEGGTRVPFIVRWPGHVPAGRVDDQSVMSGLDWLPTVASLAGADIPWHLVEGEDMSDVWLGNTRSRENPLFFRQLQSFGRVYVRYGRWKFHKKEKELYDLFTDPEERNNIYDLRSNVVTILTASTQAWEATLPTRHARLPDEPLPFDPEREVVDIAVPNIPDSFESVDDQPPTASPVHVVPSEPPSNTTDGDLPQPSLESSGPRWTSLVLMLIAAVWVVF